MIYHGHIKHQQKNPLFNESTVSAIIIIKRISPIARNRQVFEELLRVSVQSLHELDLVGHYLDTIPVTEFTH